jgi:hypothetical protein
MKISNIAIVPLICLATTACKKKDTANNTKPAGNTPVAYSISVSGNMRLLQPVQFTANGTEGHKVFWDFGDQQTGDGGQVSHAYNRPDSFTVSLRLDDINTKPVATARIGISTGIEKYAGVYHWHVHYYRDSVGDRSEWLAERDIAISSPNVRFVQVAADNDSFGYFRRPQLFQLYFVSDSLYTYYVDTTSAYHSNTRLYYNPKTGDISFVRSHDEFVCLYWYYYHAEYNK